MSDELQMTDAVRMERAIIRIALLLAPDEAVVGVNFEELPGQVQALVAERDRLRAVVEAAQRWKAAEPGHEASLAIQAMYEALAALDAKEGT